MDREHVEGKPTFLKRIRQWLRPPIFPGDEEKNRRADLMHMALWYTLAYTLLLLPVLWLGSQGPGGLLPTCIAGAILVVGLIFLLRRGLVTLVSIAFLNLSFVWVTLVLFIQGTIRTPMAATYMLTVILAGALFGRRGIFSSVALSSLLVFGLIGAQTAGLMPRPDTSVSLVQWLAFTGLFAMAGGLSFYINKTTKTALQHARRSMQEHERAAQELRKSQAHFSTIFQTSPVGIIISRLDGVFIDANQGACDLFGYSREELAGRMPIELNLWVHMEQRAAMLQAFHDTGRVRNFEIQMRRKPGEIVEIMTNVERIELNGEPHMLALLLDITERKKAERAEREQRALAEALQASAAALNSTLNFNEVLDRIIENVGRVVPHDSAGIFLLDESRQYAEVVDYRDLRDQPIDRKGTRFRLAETRSLREMIEHDAPIIIDDILTFEGWLISEHPSTSRSGLGAPVRVKGTIIGFLWLSSVRPGTFQAQHAASLQAFANYAGIAIENAQLYEKVQKLALTDGLTGIFNRTFFETELARMELGRDFPISIIIADLDNMKATNDRLGHPAGDELLRNTVRVLQSSFRAADIIARIGGDEFALLLPNTNADTANEILARIRARLAEYNLAHPDLAILLSLGVATAEHGKLVDTFVLADQRMYLNKSIHKSGYRDAHMIDL